METTFCFVHTFHPSFGISPKTQIIFILNRGKSYKAFLVFLIDGKIQFVESILNVIFGKIGFKATTPGFLLIFLLNREGWWNWVDVGSELPNMCMHIPASDFDNFITKQT